MTTISVVRKAGQTAIAADTLTKWGSGKESAKYILNSEKIIRIDDNFIAVTGNATFKMILKEYFVDNAQLISLRSVDDIFRTWNQLHLKLKEKYFLMPNMSKINQLPNCLLITLLFLVMLLLCPIVTKAMECLLVELLLVTTLLFQTP